MQKVARAITVLGLMVATGSALADWGAPLKWDQFDNPDPSGRTVESWFTANSGQGMSVADDFVCTQTGYINEIRVRGRDDYYIFGTYGCEVDIWADVPGTPTDESHPGTLLKSWVLPVANQNDPHKVGWYDAGGGEYRIDLPEGDWFLQQGTPSNPVVYWVGVRPKKDTSGIEQFHWNLRDNLDNSLSNPPDIHNGDDAVVWDYTNNVWRHLGAYYYTDPIFGDHYWKVESYAGTLPQGWRSVDTEFQVYGTPEPASLGLLAVAGLALLRRR